MHDWMDVWKLIAHDERFLTKGRLSGINDLFKVGRCLGKYSFIFSYLHGQPICMVRLKNFAAKVKEIKHASQIFSCKYVIRIINS